MVRVRSQIIFLKRDGKELETLVEGYLKNEKLIVTSIIDMDCNDLQVTEDEKIIAWEYLYDSIFNYTGPGM